MNSKYELDFMSEKAFRASLIGFVLVLLISIPVVKCDDGYLNEFNNPGEHSEVVSKWSFLTLDGKYRTVHIYKYCKDGCVHVAFDVKNKELLAEAQTEAIFENDLIRGYISDGSISESDYTCSIEGESEVCEFIIPERFVGEITKDGAKIALTNLPKFIPGNAMKIIGKSAAAIPGVNIPIVVGGVACIGGSVLESSAISSLETCKRYISDLRDFKSYEGEYDDLINSHDVAIESLENAKNSPRVWLNFVETGAADTVTNIPNSAANWGWSLAETAFGFFNYTCEQQHLQHTETDNERIERELDKLLELSIKSWNIDSKAEPRATESVERLKQKSREASGAISSLQTKIFELGEMIEENEDFDDTLSSILFIQPNFSEEKNAMGVASSQLASASINMELHKYNSAISDASEGISLVDTSTSLVIAKINEPEAPTPIGIGVIALLIIIACLFIKSKQRKPQRSLYHSSGYYGR